MTGHQRMIEQHIVEDFIEEKARLLIVLLGVKSKLPKLSIPFADRYSEAIIAEYDVLNKRFTHLSYLYGDTSRSGCNYSIEL